MRIALFVTCLADTLFPPVARATVTLLERLGHEVVFPPGQTCCGQMHINTGYQRQALPVVRHHVEVFEPFDVVVAPSGSCVGSVRHQHARVARRAGDEALARRAEAVGERTWELSELLVDVLGVEDVGASFPHRVTYHPTVPLAADAAGGRQAAAACCARCAGWSWWSCPRRSRAAASAGRSR
jgi:L-lactate dehydrogenase complex protein LldE